MNYLTIWMFLAMMPNEYGIPGVVDVVLNEPIHLDYDETMFGASKVPNATVTTEDKIFVNKAFLSLPRWAKETMIAHEMGHKHFGHVDMGTMERIDAVLMGYVYENELIADEYAVSLVGLEDVMCALALTYHTMLSTQFAPPHLQVIIMSEIWMRAEEISQSSIDLMSPNLVKCFAETNE